MPLSRWMALLEVLAVSGVPTQITIYFLLVFVVGMPMPTTTNVPLGFFATLSLLDTAAVALLIRSFLWLSGERSRDVFLGSRPVRGEALRGLALAPVVFLGVTGTVLVVRLLVPWTHTVAHNPLEAYLQTPLEAGIFLVVVVLAGGVREELQRAFILHRFDQRLGGVGLGLLLFSITFGALHYDQGVDVAVAIGLLGLFWGIVYVRRRSAVLPMVNHASFNAIQVLQGVVVKMLGG